MKTLFLLIILSAPAFAQERVPDQNTRSPEQKLCDDLTEYQQKAAAKAAVEQSFHKKYGKNPSCTAHEINKELDSKTGDMKKICTKAQGSFLKYLKYLAKHQRIEAAIKKEIETVNQCDGTDLSMSDLQKDAESLIKR